ncbi:hypothetical protein [Bacillus sp. RS11]|uniref:hypothetical protein n=1 Tax=Lysinibacillus sp. RS11 TaxID=3242682 RepID=UPI0035C6FCB6
MDLMILFITLMVRIAISCFYPSFQGEAFRRFSRSFRRSDDSFRHFDETFRRWRFFPSV